MATVAIERLRELLAYDPETGALTWRVKRYRVSPGDVVRSRNTKGYVTVMVDQNGLLAHRVAWALTTGAWPNEQLDHINGDKTDNRLANLREVSNAENRQNRRTAQRDNKLSVLGVCRHAAAPGRFMAQIKVSGVKHYLGLFDTPQLAHEAYLRAKRELHPCGTL